MLPKLDPSGTPESLRALAPHVTAPHGLWRPSLPVVLSLSSDAITWTVICLPKSQIGS